MCVSILLMRKQPKQKLRRLSVEAYADRLRENMTRCERIMWQLLKRVKPKWEAQAVVCGFIADFWCPSLQIVVEIDGAVHRKRSVKVRDKWRDGIMRRHSITVLRFSNKQVVAQRWSVLRAIRLAAASRIGDGIGSR